MARNIRPPTFRRNGYDCGTARAGGRDPSRCVSEGRGIEHTINIGGVRGVNHRWRFGGGGSAEEGGGVNSARGVGDG